MSSAGDSPPALRDQVAQMFGAIADHYDLMNWLMTLGQDQRWRRQAAEVANVQPGGSALDVAAGTGDLAIELARRVGDTGRVIGIDISEPMLAIARRKAKDQHLGIAFEQGDALELPYEADRFDAVTCAFGIRNIEDRISALEEMTRVTKPSGRVVVLELSPPANQLARKYMDEIIPRLGGLIARAREAYTYLPASVTGFPPPETLGRMMQSAGLRGVTYRLLNFGTVALHWGVKPQA